MEKCSEQVIKEAESTITKLLELFEKGISFSPKIQKHTYTVFVDAAPKKFFGLSCGTAK
jgi:hypothetical protein